MVLLKISVVRNGRVKRNFLARGNDAADAVAHFDAMVKAEAADGEPVMNPETDTWSWEPVEFLDNVYEV